MKNRSSILFCFLFALPIVVGQNKFDFTLRGKPIAFGLEDVIWYNVTGGAAFNFFTNHAIGFDYILLGTMDEYDINDEESNGPNHNIRTQFLLTDYRYYLRFDKLEEKKLTPYVNAFGKIGIRREWQELEYDKNMEIINNQTNIRQIGVAAGFHWGRRIGLDLNVGVARSFEKHNELNRYTQTNVYESIHSERSRFVPVLRINLFFTPGKR